MGTKNAEFNADFVLSLWTFCHFRHFVFQHLVTFNVLTFCNDSGYRTIKYDEQLGVDSLLVRDRLVIQAP